MKSQRTTTQEKKQTRNPEVQINEQEIGELSETEEQIIELEDKMVEMPSEEKNKVKRMKRTEDNLRDLWDNIKCTNIRIIGVPEEKRKRKGVRKFLKKL